MSCSYAILRARICSTCESVVADVMLGNWNVHTVVKVPATHFLTQ